MLLIVKHVVRDSRLAWISSICGRREAKTVVAESQTCQVENFAFHLLGIAIIEKLLKALNLAIVLIEVESGCHIKVEWLKTFLCRARSLVSKSEAFIRV